MANEIRVLDGDGGRNYRVLLLFPIAAPTQLGGTNVVPTPSSGLDPLAALVAQVPTDVRPALDAGTLAYSIVVFAKDLGLTNAQLATRLQDIYTHELARLTTWYQARYQHIGTVLNAP